MKQNWIGLNWIEINWIKSIEICWIELDMHDGNDSKQTQQANNWQNERLSDRHRSM